MPQLVISYAKESSQTVMSVWAAFSTLQRLPAFMIWDWFDGQDNCLLYAYVFLAHGVSVSAWASGRIFIQLCCLSWKYLGCWWAWALPFVVPSGYWWFFWWTMLIARFEGHLSVLSVKSLMMRRGRVFETLQINSNIPQCANSVSASPLPQ